MRKRKRRSPAFQLYVADWLSSPSILLMNSAQEGAYLRLLLHQWNSPDFALPNDDQKLAVLSRLGDSWDEVGPAVKACFEQHPKDPTKLINKRLGTELKKQREWKLKSALGGVKSGQSRRKATKGGSRLVQPNGNSSFSSSDLSKDNPAEAVFTQLAELIHQRGASLSTAWSFLGKCRKEHAEGEVLHAARATLEKNIGSPVLDPKGYMKSILEKKPARGTSQAEMNRSGQKRVVV